MFKRTSVIAPVLRVRSSRAEARDLAEGDATAHSIT